MGGNDLKKADKLYRRKKYTQILQLLESQIFRYRQSFQFYYLLGMACVYTGDFSGGESYLQRALSLKPGNKNALLGIAAVHLKQQKTSEALKDWFEVIDQDPKNRQANRGLAVVRRHADPDELIAFTDSNKLYKLLPREHRIGTSSIILIILAVLIGIGVLFYPLYGDYLSNLSSLSKLSNIGSQKVKRPEISKLDLTVENYTATEQGQSSVGRTMETNKTGQSPDSSSSDQASSRMPVVLFEMDRKEIKTHYEKLITHFNNYEDNLAQREINRLLLSNASTELKNKVSTLSTYTRTPSFDSLKNNFTYENVKEEPRVYQNCFVIWKGRVSNLVVNESAIRFDLLVGYETEKVLEGIVPVQLTFGAHIDPAFPIEVLGKIQTNGRDITLTAESIHQFIPEEE